MLREVVGKQIPSVFVGRVNEGLRPFHLAAIWSLERKDYVSEPDRTFPIRDTVWTFLTIVNFRIRPDARFSDFL